MPARTKARSIQPVRRGDIRLLADRLNRLYDTYDIAYLDPDPLLIVREFTEPYDREIAGLYAAALAFGGVKQIMSTLRDLFSRMGPSPAAFVRSFDPGTQASTFNGWYHRFITSDDIVVLTWSIGTVLDEYDSLGACFTAGFTPADADIGPALTRFVSRLRQIDRCPVPPGRFFTHLLSSPADSSACKRMNLYLRWMVRQESPDLGLWADIPASHLLLPLDTHTARISRNIGLTSRATANWRMAREITDQLAEIDPNDPVKFDYAICRLGILDRCPRAMDPAKCAKCIIRDVCVL